MKQHITSAACAVVALFASSPVLAQQPIVADAAAALGGRDRILAARTLVIEGEGTNGNLGQDMTPDASGQQFLLSNYRRSIDLAQGRARTEQTRTPNFTYFQGPQPQTQVLGLDGAIAYNVGANGAATRLSGAAASDRRVEFYHHPLTLLRAALDPAAKISDARGPGGGVDVELPNGVRLTAGFDTATKLPAWVRSVADNTVLGDVVVQTTFADYRDVSGLKLPARLTTTTDRWPTAEVRAAKQTLDAETGDLAAPPPPAAAAPAAAPAGITVTAEVVAPGLWLLAGQSHHSVLVEFADHLALIEAPQNDARALAVIAKAREVRPGKPLTQVIVTHHHFDHSGGVRAAMAEGLEVVTHRGNVAFFEEVAKRPHTVLPDALSRSPRAARVTGVGDELILKDAGMELRLYAITGNAHTDTMVVAYFPTERVLVQADLFPQAAAPAYQSNLLENLRKRNLSVDRIVGIHGTIQPFSALEGAAK